MSRASVDRPGAIVNIGSVPHRSPFRYPGGKTWFVPAARAWLRACAGPRSMLIEPFAGGAITGLTAVFEGLVGRAELAELDPRVASVWRTALSDDCGWLCVRIESFEISEANVRAVLDDRPGSDREEAFATILRNRVQHGGIMAPGASLMRSGENGRGLRSRWYPATLVKRLRAIHGVRDRVGFAERDGLGLLREHRRRGSAAAFIDPPYTASRKSAGARLYAHHELDHEELFAITARYAGPVVMTYDDCEDVRVLADRHGLSWRAIPMRGRRNSVMRELVIGNDLGWLEP